MGINAQNALQRAYENYCQILVLVTQQIASGTTQAGLDAIAALSAGTGILQPKLSYSVDGENVQWMEYQQYILTNILLLEQAIQRASGPFEIRSRGG
jgi:hypothetical protein